VGPRVVLAGYLVRYPLGGYAWQALHFLEGLRSLGCDAFFYEDSAYYADAYVPGSGGMQTADYDYGVRFAADFFAAHGFAAAWGFWDVAADRWSGAGAERTRAALADADLFINLAGVNRVPRARRSRATSVFVDLDPSYTQLRLAAGDAQLASLVGDHDLQFTLGESIGTPGCRIPQGGFAWRPLRQPVVPELWTPLGPEPGAPFTTIGKWDATGRDVTFEGEAFAWRKRTEWWRFLDLPQRTGERFSIAMDVASHPEDLARLGAAGWEVVDPLAVSRDPHTYRAFIRRSRGEFTVAKDVNVRLRSGWFSDRSVCYLAAGRPVVNQDTGFEDHLPVGAGLFAFRTPEDVVAAMAAIADDYPRHHAFRDDRAARREPGGRARRRRCAGRAHVHARHARLQSG
jgi:hypothetical protein